MRASERETCIWLTPSVIRHLLLRSSLQEVFVEDGAVALGHVGHDLPQRLPVDRACQVRVEASRRLRQRVALVADGSIE